MLLASCALLSACGGGLSGSGDGGDPGGRAQLGLPGFEGNSYKIESFPVGLAAAIPDSLNHKSSNTDPSDSTSPYRKIGALVKQITDGKVELGLLQLHIDTNWLAILDHCSTTAADSSCDLKDAGIQSLYTQEMAAWEFILRATLAQEKLGSSATLSEKSIADIATLVRSKIGSKLKIDNGTFKHFSSGPYKYEVVSVFDFGSGATHYTVRWSGSLTRAFVSYTNTTDDTYKGTHISVNAPENGNGVDNSILVTTVSGEDRVEQQLNLRNTHQDLQLQLETHISEVIGTTRTDTYSIGKASDQGGFLRSEIKTRTEDDTVTSLFHREAFNGEALLEATATCDTGTSTASCDEENRWVTTSGIDPVLSEFYLTQNQLDELETSLTPFDLKIEGLSTASDVLILLRRENLSISVSADGFVLSIPGLGEVKLSLTNPEANQTTSDLDLKQIDKLADSVLCRVNVEPIDGEVTYRSFCAGTTEEIEDTIVVGEAFRNGKLSIEWESNAKVTVVHRPDGF